MSRAASRPATFKSFSHPRRTRSLLAFRSISRGRKPDGTGGQHERPPIVRSGNGGADRRRHDLVATIGEGHRPRCDSATVGRLVSIALVFTMAEIDDIHARLGNAQSLADYLRALATIGVVRFESFVADGHSEFFDSDGDHVASSAHHKVLSIANSSDRDAFLEQLRRHNDGETSYVEMSEGLADSGIEKWVADTTLMTMTYFDRAGDAILVEHVE